MLAHRSAMGIEVHAPAKLNLFFEVLSKRSDGYHEIETLMVPVSLYDTLRLQSRKPPTSGEPEPISLSLRHCDSPTSTDGSDVPIDGNNLVVRAVHLLRDRSRVCHGAEIKLVKRIPSRAGLGGGSSDAAAALVAANMAWKLGWSRERLSELAAELGSDVPFFVQSTPAVCRGRGEQIQPVCRIGDIHAVVVYPPVGLSTAEVYGACSIPKRPRPASSLIKALQAGSSGDCRRYLFNRLEAAATTLSPWIRKLKKYFDQTTCITHQMTGSGSAYFGICHNARHAAQVSKQLEARACGHVFPVRRAA